jgi:large subunit ribosomal protein L25
MQRIELQVGLRDGHGKGAARKLRVAGEVPAVLYGRGAEPVALRVNRLSLDKVVQRSANALLDLKGTQSVEGKIVLLKAVQRDPVRRVLIHADFLVVDPKRAIEVSVPLHFIGKPKGLEEGGVLEPLLRELEIRVLPLSIPDSIDVDVSALLVGQSIHVRDIRLPEGAELMTDPEQSVVHVIIPRMEIEPVAAPEPVEGEVPAEGEAAAAATAPAAGDAKGGKAEAKPAKE